MKTIGDWLQGLDDPIKIGWPWHGLLEQVSPTLCTLTSPSGQVINFPAGDTSHAISYPVNLTTSTSWRSGICQRFQIPGLPVPATTPAELADGMTWLNYFVQSGIAKFPGAYAVLVDEDNLAWHWNWEYVGMRPAVIKILHCVNGAFVTKLQINIPDPGFVRVPINVKTIAFTSSSNGRTLAFNVFGLNNPLPIWSFTLDITGRVLDGSLAATITKLVDDGISGLSGTQGDGTTFTFTGTWSASASFKQQEATMGSQGWGPYIDNGVTDINTAGGGYGPTNASSITGAQLPGVPQPPLPATTATKTYRWLMTAYDDDRSGYSESLFTSFDCMGYFIGHDDQLIRIDQNYEKKSWGTDVKAMGSPNVTLHAEVEYSDYATVGATVSPKVTVKDVFHGVNQASQTQAAGPRGWVVNLLEGSRKGVAVVEATGVPDQYRYRYVVCQAGSASLYPSVFSITAQNLYWPDPPNFSVHPVTGQIATRANDGYSISWV